MVGEHTALQIEALAEDAQEDSEPGDTAQTITGTARALPVQQIEELPSMSNQHIPLTSKTDKDLQWEVNKFTVKTARLDLQILLKEKQHILKQRQEQLKALALPELHAQSNSQGHLNNLASGKTRPQSDTSMAKILIVTGPAQQSAEEPKIICKKSKKKLCK